jgi:hypothetical protein
VTCAFVYYRIDPAQASLAAARIDELLITMGGHCSQPPQRLNRCDDPTTWMEIYLGIADFATFTTALSSAAQAFGCAEFVQGERHLECFSAPVTAP